MSSDQCQPGSNRLLAMAKSPSRTILNSPWGNVRVSSGVPTFFRCSVAMREAPFFMTPSDDPSRSGWSPVHLDVFPAHVAIEQLGHAAVPGILLGHRGQLLVGRLVLDERDKDQLLWLPVGMANQLHDLAGDLGPDGLQPFLHQGVELCLPSGPEPRVTNSSEHSVLLLFQQLTTVVTGGRRERSAAREERSANRLTRFALLSEPGSSQRGA